MLPLKVCGLKRAQCEFCRHAIKNTSAGFVTCGNDNGPKMFGFSCLRWSPLKQKGASIYGEKRIFWHA